MTAFFYFRNALDFLTNLNSLKRFVVYIIYSEKLNRFYVGTTDDFEERLTKHNSGHFADSFLVKGIPWITFLVIENLTSEQALSIERHIKSMKSSKYIRNLKLYPELVERLIAKFE